MVKQFENVLDIINGRNQKNVENPSGKYPIYGSGGAIGYADDYLCEANTVVIGRKGSINHPIYVEEPFWNVDTAFGLVAKKDILLPKYLYFFCVHYDFDKLNTTVTIPSLTKANLLKIEIDVPGIDEQKKIVNLLDKIEEIINEEKQQLDELDNIIKARFVEMFGDPITNSKGWSMVELGDLTNIGSSKRIFEKEYVDSGIPFYRTKEIVELSKGKAVTTEIYISKERFAEIKKQYGAPKIDDLLISAVGTIGTIWVVDGKSDFYFKDGNLIRVDASDKFNSIFMKQLLESLIDEYKKQISAGTAYAALTISGLTKMRVYDVPKEFQDKYADFVHKADKLKLSVTKNLEKIETLKSALMQKFFS